MRGYASKMRVMVVLVAVVFQGVRSDGSGESGEKGDCRCRASTTRYPAGTCSSVPAGSVAILGCPGTNQFLQCSGPSSCNPVLCPAGQVWNALKNGCSACQTGMQMTSNGQRCVCPANTQLDKLSQKCLPCAAGATSMPGRECACTNYQYRVNPSTNACVACPPGADSRTENDCRCLNTTTVFQASSWSCIPCPGSLVSNGRKGVACQCTGAQQMLNRKTAACFTCPPGTTVDRDHDECRCTGIREAEFHMTSATTGVCVCEPGKQLDATNTTCVRAVVPLLPANVPGIPVAVPGVPAAGVPAAAPAGSVPEPVAGAAKPQP